MTLHLYDDPTARTWEPFVLTRPIGELLFGCLTLRERAERVWGLPCTSHLADPDLEGFDEPGAPPVATAPVGDSESRVLVNSRAALVGAPMPSRSDAARLIVGGRVAGWILPGGVPTPQDSVLFGNEPGPGGIPDVEVAGEFIEAPWDLVARNAERVAADQDLVGFQSLEPSKGVRVIGGGGLFGRGGATVEPGVIVDTTAGPVLLDGGSLVQGPGRVTGPCYVGRGSTVLGGSLARTSIGPACKVRGEVSDSILTGYCNKAHDGYLGHALLGRWVNLGALTTNSDLKNTYGEVRVELSTGGVETGELKVGCFLGDHVRTGIGTLLATGAVVGAGSVVMGGGVAPRFLPPFSWHTADGTVPVRLDGFLRTAERVVARRNQSSSPDMTDLWTRAHQKSRPQREDRGILG